MSTPTHMSPVEPPVQSEASYPFHRLMRRTEGYRWWRPLAFTGTGIGFFGVLLIVIMAVIAITMLMNPMTWADEDASAGDPFTEVTLNMASPADFAMTMGSLIIMIPAVYLAYLLIGPKPAGLLLSVAGKLRWRWFGLALGTSAVLFALYFGLSFGLGALGVGDSSPVPADSIPTDPLFYALLVILLTPFQCAAEELVFRGALMQVIGSWLKHPLFAILLPVPLFTAGHLYDVWGLLDVAVFAVAAGYLTWRTGGLEAAMAVHIINNTFLFLLGAMGLVDLNAEGSDPSSLIFSVVFTALLTFILAKLAAKQNIQRTAGPMPRVQPDPRIQPWPMMQPPQGQQGQQPFNPGQAYWAPPAQPPVPPQAPNQWPPVQPPADESPNEPGR